MKQFLFEYSDKESLDRQLLKIKQWCRSFMVSNILFTVYSSKLDKEKLGSICANIKKIVPESSYVGATTNGNIINGDVSKSDTIIACTIFEYPSTKVRVLQYNLSQESEKSVTSALIKLTNEESWVKAVMILTTMRGMSMTDFSNDLSSLREDISVFGGGAISEDINNTEAFVFSSAGEITDHSVVFVLLGGKDFHTNAIYITGWKPLGRELKITKAKDSVLYELDGKPAYETYYKYLNISNDENFFHNTLEFPFLYNCNGISLLRAPTGSNPDGSLNMTSDMIENVNARIAYGDPWTILDTVRTEARNIMDFQPEVIHIFSCAARRTFWGTAQAGKETLPFQHFAPTSGFFTSGEFLRTNGMVNQHNVTLVVAAMREGDKNDFLSEDDFEFDDSQFTGQVSMINRLATFIQASTEELEEANKKLALAYRHLEMTAISDGMTMLLNRSEIQNRISSAIKAKLEKETEKDKPLGISLIMIDLDFFKKVNDRYGHKEGDHVLISLADMLKQYILINRPICSAGRWGGEEFMILLPECSRDEAVKIAEDIREKFSKLTFPHAEPQTMSLGVTEALSSDNPDTTCMRVDTALYNAKNNGRNRTEVL